MRSATRNSSTQRPLRPSAVSVIRLERLGGVAKKTDSSVSFCRFQSAIVIAPTGDEPSIARARGMDGTKPSDPLESTAVVSGDAPHFAASARSGRHRIHAKARRGQQTGLHERDSKTALERSERLPHSGGSLAAEPTLTGRGARSKNGLFNGTKPIFIENKGSLEERTQTKPNNEPTWIGLSC
jgi:hypothetical protein